MSRHNIVCGGVTASFSEGQTLQLNVQGTGQNVNLKILDIHRAMVSSVPDVLMDLLEIAAYVYCADQRIRRGGETLHNHGEQWRSELHFTIPVRDPALWNSAAVKQALQDTLWFMSDHYFEFDFVASRTALSSYQHYLEFAAAEEEGIFVPDHVALFSGGLDSFAGAVDFLVGQGKNMALVGHHSCPKVFAAQKNLIAELKNKGLARKLFYVPVQVTNQNTTPAEYTQRTRSFLFASLAMTIATLFNKDEVIFFENGMVSLNLPISTDVVGARATRTTHPRVLQGFQTLFSLILNRPITVRNPYIWKTKAEVAAIIAQNNCNELVGATRSCTRPYGWTKQYVHCGVCSQCIDRRFGILAAGLGTSDPAAQYRLDLLLGSRTDPKDIGMAAHYIRFAREISQTTLTAFLREFPEVSNSTAYFPELTQEEALKQIFELHHRHAKDVNGVIDKGLKDNSSKITEGSLPVGSILGLVGNTREKIEVVAAPDITPAMKAFVDRLKCPPCEFAIDDDRQIAVFNGGIILKDNEYQFMKMLVSKFRSGKKEPESEIVCISAGTLAARFHNGNEQSLRQFIKRLREKLAERLSMEQGIPLDTDDIIENIAGRGYRLNRSLKEVAFVTDLMPQKVPEKPVTVTA